MSWHTPRNFASTTVTSGDLNNTTTPITISVAAGANLGSTWPMYATVDPTGTTPEVVEITARTGDSITLTRASAVAHTGAPTIVCAVAAQYITELQTAVDLKAPIANPTFTGVPAAPTAAAATNTTQIATTAFVQGEIAAIASTAMVSVDVPATIGASVAWVQTTGTWAVDTTAGLYQCGALLYNSSHANADKITSSPVQVPVSGTYTAYVLHKMDTNVGKWDFKMNGSLIGSTYDGYAASAITNKWTSFSLGSLTAGTTYTFSVTVNGKNASSSDYYAALQAILLVKA